MLLSQRSLQRRFAQSGWTRAAAFCAWLWSASCLAALGQTTARYQETLFSIQQQIEADDLIGARSALGKAMKTFPDDGGLENLLGVVEIRQGQPARARDDFAAAIRHSPKLVGAYLNLARLDLESGQNQQQNGVEALRLYEKVVTIEPKNAEANYQAAILLMRGGRFQASLEHLSRLEAEQRASTGVRLAQCADEAGLHHDTQASDLTNALIADSQLTEEDGALIFPALQSARRADLIEQIYGAIDRQHPLSAAGLRVLGLAEEANNKLDAARATLERAFTADAGSIQLLLDLARVAEEAKDDRGALGYLAHARALDPANPLLPYKFGLICARMNLFVESRKALEESVKLGPESADANFSLGTVLSFDEDPLGALPYLQKYLSLRPGDPAGALALGTAYFRAKDLDNAQLWFAKATKGAQTGAYAHYFLGRIARRKGSFDVALAELSESLRMNSGDAEVHAELGQLLIQMDRTAEAEHELNAAVSLNPDSYAANFGLLQLYARTNDSRRSEQEKRFKEIKEKNDQDSKDRMRAIEIDPAGDKAGR